MVLNLSPAGKRPVFSSSLTLQLWISPVAFFKSEVVFYSGNWLIIWCKDLVRAFIKRLVALNSFNMWMLKNYLQFRTPQHHRLDD